jgi:hypothetical protein
LTLLGIKHRTLQPIAGQELASSLKANIMASDLTTLII